MEFAKKTSISFRFCFFSCINRNALENWSLLLKDTVKVYKPENDTRFNLVNFDKKRPLVGICFISIKWKVSITKWRFFVENLFPKTLPLLSRVILKETMTSSPHRELRASRNNPTIHFNLKNKRSHHEMTYHDHRYYSLLNLPKLHTTTGKWLEIIAIKR